MNPIDYLIDIVAENSANPNRKVSCLCVIAILIGIFECCYVYGMTKCFFQEARRSVIHSSYAHMCGRSCNIHLFEPKHTDVWPVFYDGLMANARTHTPGWYRIGMMQGRTNRIIVACSLRDEYEETTCSLRRGTGFYLGFEMNDDGHVRDLRVQETLRPLYYFKCPSMFLAERKVLEFDDGAGLLAYWKKKLHMSNMEKMESADSFSSDAADAVSKDKDESEVSK